ncbi:MAG TPA: PEGA domain-containing protein, partial [Bryobacteraceae bacterium]|nr:PEGA domain-containing protein [Bryobacteraceae bacterium]
QLGPAEIILQGAKVPVRLSVSPAGATVSYKGADNQSHPVTGPTVELEEGQYTFTASAPGHADASQVVAVAAGKNNTVSLTLTAAKKVPARTGPVAFEEWAAATGWKHEGDWWLHRGGNAVLYPAVPTAGTFIFTALRQGHLLGTGRLQWVLNYAIEKSSYVLFGVDKKNIHRAEFEGGKKVKDSDANESLKTAAAAGKDLQYSIKIEVSSDSVVTSVQAQGGNWVTVDTWRPSGCNPAEGKFGFYLPGSDEIYISNFSFTPAR